MAARFASNTLVARLAFFVLLSLALPTIAYATLGDWTAQSAAAPYGLYAVDFVGSDCGWAVGWGSNSGEPGTILATTDGGAHWSAQSPGDNGAALTSVDFVDPAHGWVAGSNNVLSTEDGGAHWQVRTAPSMNSIQSVAFTDALVGWAVGDRIAKTADGGDSWVTQMSEPNRALMSAAFLDAEHGWAVGYEDPGGSDPVSPMILATSDGGDTWAVQYSEGAEGSGMQLRSVSFADAQHGWAVGDNTLTGGVILATSDGGAHWSKANYDDFYFQGVSFADAQHGWAVGYYSSMGSSSNLILGTADGGVSWSIQKMSPIAGAPLCAVSAPDARSAWAVGEIDQVLRYGTSDPVPNVPGNGETEEPVIVLVAGLSSDTGSHAAPPALGQWQFGWEMNRPGYVGGPWENYLATQAAAYNLGARKVLVAPTAAGVKDWPADAAAGVIDSTGALDDDTAKLVSWLRRPDTQEKIGESPIIFIGHSYGGVIARSMLASNELPEGDPIRKQIAGIIQLASPNGGSPMADVALNAGHMGTLGDVLSIFFPVRSDIMWQLRPSEMKAWNIENPGRVEVPVYRIGGNYLPDAMGAFGADWINWTLSSQYKKAKAGMVAMNTIFGGIENDGIVSKKSIKNGDGSLDVEAWDFDLPAARRSSRSHTETSSPASDRAQAASRCGKWYHSR